MKGDFLGFTFITGEGTYTCEDLGITRTSDGDRYNDTIPEIEDKTVEIPGLDGSYFYGSNFKNRQFSIKIAFDEMTEANFRKFKQVFGYKHTGELIFDEAPYKKYLVKVASAPELDYVCFDERARTASTTSTPTGIRIVDREHNNANRTETISVPQQSEITYTLTDVPNSEVTVEGAAPWEEGTEEAVTYTTAGRAYTITNTSENDVDVTFSYTTLITTITREDITPWVYSEGTQRIYKGEGTIEFIAYFPFAKSVYKTLADSTNENKNEWKDAVNLLPNLDGYDIWPAVQPPQKEGYTDAIKVYNPGDIETGFRLYIPFPYTLEQDSEDNTKYNRVYAENCSISSFGLSYGAAALNVGLDGGSIIRKGTDETGIIIDTTNGLIEGVTRVEPLGQYITTGNLYNEYALGEFFKIQPEKSNVSQYIYTKGLESINVLNEQLETQETVVPLIYYDYLYF